MAVRRLIIIRVRSVTLSVPTANWPGNCC